MADSATLTPENSRLIVNGVPMAFGRASGTYATFAYDSARYQAVAGVDGTGYYVRTNIRKATTTLVVLPTSEENGLLAGWLAAQDLAPNGFTWPLIVQRGTMIYTGVCVIEGDAPVEYSDGPGTNTWRFLSTRMIGKQGGMPATPLGPA